METREPEEDGPVSVFYRARAQLVRHALRALRSVGWRRGGPPRYWLANRFPCTNRPIG